MRPLGAIKLAHTVVWAFFVACILAIPYFTALARFGLVPDTHGGLDLTAEQQAELRQALAEADRGEGVDGWRLLEELTGD